MRRVASLSVLDAGIYAGVLSLTGSPEDVAEEMRRRLLARDVGYVYVRAHVRTWPKKRRRRRTQ